jgi:diguanylate cyclase (GGDEF)-like protein
VITHEPATEVLEELLRDPLTGLPIPALQQEHLQLALLRARRNDTAVALLLVELDGLHEVQDRFGPAIGDLAIQSITGRLRSALRTTDVLSRLQDDRFSILCEDITSPDDVDRIAHRVRAAVTAPLLLDGHRVELGATVGRAVSTGGSSIRQLLADADAAVTEAREPVDETRQD